MASTYSTSLKLELIGSGDQSGTWGNTTNNNLGNLLEQAITGVQSIVFSSDADYTLTNYNGTIDEARNAVLNLSSTTTVTAGRNVIVPAGQNKLYAVTNGLSVSINIKVGSSGSSLAIPAGATVLAYVNGTGNTITPVAPVAGSSVSSGSGSVVYNTSPTLLSPTIGTPTITGGSITGNFGLNASGLYNLNGWGVSPSGSKLYFSYNGVNVATLDSSGNMVLKGTLTQNGTPT